MAKKGEAKKLKALNAPKTVKISRKENTWTVRTGKGPHKKNDSVALLIVLRDLIKLGDNLKEIKKILNANNVKVNEKVVKDYSLAIGLFDVITIEKQKLAYIALFDKKRRIVLKQIEKPLKQKIVKVVGRTVTKKGLQIATNDGRIIKNDKAKIGDSLKVNLPKYGVEKILELKKGSIVYLTKGAHCASTGKITEIILGSVSKEKLVRVEINKKEYETVERNVIVIGEDKSEINEIN